MHCTVLRPISGPDGPIEAGRVIDTSTWRKRNRDVLIARKYLQEELLFSPVPYVPVPPSTPDDESEPEKMPGKKAR